MSNTPTENKQWANPTPAGLVALAVACFCFFALLTGKVDKSAMPLMGCFLVGGFFIQMVVGLLDLKSKNLAGGNTFLYFSIYFMLVSGAEMFLKYFVSGLDTRIDGWAWLALAFVVISFTPAFYKSPAILFIIVLVLDIAVPCIVVADLRIFDSEVSAVFSQIAGYALLICGILGIYLAAAMIVNGTYGKKIIPNPESFYKNVK